MTPRPNVMALMNAALEVIFLYGSRTASLAPRMFANSCADKRRAMKSVWRVGPFVMFDVMNRPDHDGAQTMGAPQEFDETVTPSGPAETFVAPATPEVFGPVYVNRFQP